MESRPDSEAERELIGKLAKLLLHTRFFMNTNMTGLLEIVPEEISAEVKEWSKNYVQDAIKSLTGRLQEALGVSDIGKEILKRDMARTEKTPRDTSIVSDIFKGLGGKARRMEEKEKHLERIEEPPEESPTRSETEDDPAP